MYEYTRSDDDTYIERVTERKVIDKFISSSDNSRILCLYSNGEGGFGKTQLLLRLHGDYLQKKDTLIGEELIDFYDLEMKRKVGVIKTLSKQLRLNGTLDEITAYRKGESFSDEEKAINYICNVFWEEYHSVASQNDKKLILFIFDSYEHIQDVSVTGVPKSTSHSDWLETELIPVLADEHNARIIIAGRHQPIRLSDGDCQSVPLIPFDVKTSKKFLKKCLEDGVLQEEEMEVLYRQTEGHPIRLALSVDWIRNSSDFTAIDELLSEVDSGRKFEEKLIEYFISWQLNKSKSFSITKYIAIAYRRLNPEMLHSFTKGEEDIEECKKYIERIKGWSFIKPKGKDSVILHDVMRTLLNRYLSDNDPGLRTEVVTEYILPYYERKIFADKQELSETEQEAYILEMVEYGFELDFEEGVSRFCKIFEQIMDNVQYNFAFNFLLKVAEEFKLQYQKQSNTLDHLKIDAIKIDYYAESSSAPEKGLEIAEKIITEYKDHPLWKDSEVRGLILWKKGTALFALGRFLEAIECFQQANPILLQNDAGINAHWTISWTGYTYYQLGDFVSAEKELKRSRKLFYKAAVYILFKTQAWDKNIKNEYRRTLQGYQISLVNLSLVCFSTGRFYEAVRRSRIFLHINQNLQRNDREIARAQATLALTSWSVGNRLEAKLYLDDALQRVADDPLLIGRIKTEQIRQEIHNSDFFYSSFLEFYRAEDFQARLQKFKGQVQKKEGSLLPDETRLQETIQALESLGATTKELLTAYIVQAKLYLLNIEKHSFSIVEDILKKGLQEHVEANDIQAYEKMQALENLVRLCYFARSGVTDDAQAVSDKLDIYRLKLEKEFKRLETSKKKGYQVFPEIAARYQILSGNISFDEAIRQRSLERLRKALQHYQTAADLLKDFEFFCDYPFYILRHRLITFIENATELFEQKLITKEDYSELKEGYTIGSTYIRDKFDLTFTSTLLCLPQTSFEEIEKASNEDIEAAPNEFNRRTLPERIIRAKSLIAALKIFLEQQAISREERIKALLLRTIWLMQKARFYRRLRNGDINFALRAYDKAEESIDELARVMGEKSGEILSLRGRLAIGRGTVHYRQGSYEDFLEFYMKDELRKAKKLFKEHFKGEAQQAEDLLVLGKGLLKEARGELAKGSLNIHIGKSTLPNLNDRWLGAAYFRLGELKCLNGKHSVALNYLKKSIELCRAAGYTSRMLDAMESYLTVFYCKKEDSEELFSADHPQNKEYRQEIEKHEERYPIILAKLRITQGDNIFTRLFRYDEEKSKEKGIYRDDRYCLRKNIHADILPEDVRKLLRRMMTHYIEACSLMKKAENKRNFVIAVRMIIRRFRMLSDALVLEKLHSILEETWDQYPNLHDSEEELKTVSAFARILEGLIKETPEHPHTTAVH